MRIAIVGAGGVGGYLGVLLNGEHEVILLDRGEQLRALHAAGVQVRSRARGELRAHPPATDDPAEAGPVDLVLYCVKTYDNATAIPSLRPLVGPETTMLTIQNGIGNVEQLVEAYGAAAVLGGPMVGGGTRVAPGVIEHVLPLESEIIELGCPPGGSPARAEAVRAALAPTGLKVTLVPDLQRTLWTKLITMAALAGVGCLTRAGTAHWREYPATRELYAHLVQEAVAVARAEGVDLDDGVFPTALAQPDRLGPAHRTSMTVDLERGERLEVGAIHGAVVERAARHGLAVPAYQVVYAVLSYADQRAAAAR